MDIISSRAVSQSSAQHTLQKETDNRSTPITELSAEQPSEDDFAGRAKEILNITFDRVRQRLMEQQAHHPPPADQVNLICQ